MYIRIEELKNIKSDDIKDTDVIEIKGKRMTVAEIKVQARKSHEQAKQAQAKFANMAAQKLQELRQSEESKKKSRINSLSQDIASKIKIQQPVVTDQPGSGIYCDHPQIFSVYPTEVHPGDPVLITGCGFLTQTGQVVITYEGERYLTIESWTDTAIKVTIPDITGFPFPKTVAVIVKTAKGQQSALSQKITLNPNLTTDTLHGPLFFGMEAHGCSWDTDIGSANAVLTVDNPNRVQYLLKR